MTTPAGTFGTYFDGHEVGYGYGLMIEEFLGDRLVGHGGSIAVSNAWFGYLEDAELGVVLACTTSPETHPADTGMGVLALLHDEDPEAVQPHYQLMSVLEAASGEYEGYRDTGSASVERVGGGLKLESENEVGGGQELLLTPIRVEEDVLICTTTVVSGMEREIRFEFGREQTELFFDRVQLRKSE